VNVVETCLTKYLIPFSIYILLGCMAWNALMQLNRHPRRTNSKQIFCVPSIFHWKWENRHSICKVQLEKDGPMQGPFRPLNQAIYVRFIQNVCWRSVEWTCYCATNKVKMLSNMDDISYSLCNDNHSCLIHSKFNLKLFVFNWYQRRWSERWLYYDFC